MATYRAASTRLPGEKGDIQLVAPPCDTCRPEPLLPCNQAAMDVFDRCGDDWIFSGNTRVTIPAPSIETAMNIVGISDHRDRVVIFDRVKMIGRVLAGKMAEEAERQRAENAG